MNPLLAAEEAGGARRSQVVEHLGVGEPRMIVDHYVQVLVTGQASE